ncbi:9319_t:CDS:2 [Acaulospora colombiana]|uniref:9319_t:CDS:1 n=1 Tax=Acaulospora colombiana TaxID=27376 RepID=A0ACA9M6T7_9GLOM|nr:9319_t:CDS:2 [Acaulospora colombiana]
MSLVAVTQFCGTNVITKNLQICTELIGNAVRRGARVIFFPEASDFIAMNNEETLRLTSTVESNNFVEEIRKEAKKNGVWVSIGVHETLHLFDVNINNNPVLLESSTTLRGDKIVEPVESPIGRIGMMICYDLRFPELSLALRKLNADVLTYPSAFTVKTGIAHWEVLLRARAIETQSYVIASAHIGQHNDKRASFGSAMIVDPWGTILTRCPETTKPTFALAEINPDGLKQLRINMPVIEHRRNDIFV